MFPLYLMIKSSKQEVCTQIGGCYTLGIQHIILIETKLGYFPPMGYAIFGSIYIEY